jgi:peptidoglycan/xylan/chitin deacetylase (PgdA/CDA1 family)
MNIRNAIKRRLATHTLAKDGRDSVLFTFDDGPHPEGTRAVLDVLRRFAARAVFFVVGSRVSRAPELLRTIISEGHALGNHSYAHPLTRQLGLRACRRDIEQCQALTESLTGVRPTLFRPPLGKLSVASIVAPRLAGLRPIMWSVDADDWRLRQAVEVPAAADRLLRLLSNRPLHDIVLMHDERVLTAQVLELVLPRLVERNVNLRPALPSPRAWRRVLSTVTLDALRQPRPGHGERRIPPARHHAK